MRRRLAELRDFARQAGFDKFDVRRLAERMDGLEASEVEEVVDALVDERRFEQAGAVVVAAHKAGCAPGVSVLDPLAYSLDEPFNVLLTARAVDGDPVDTLIRLWESGRMSNRAEAMIAYLIGYLCEEPPAAAVTMLRLLCRLDHDHDTSVIVGEAVRLFDDVYLNKVGAKFLTVAKDQPDTSFMHRMVARPVFERLPERAARNVVSGRTVQRSGEEIGRNDPCPCDSGRKYKKCCLRRARQEGNTRPQITPTLTDRQFRDLHPHEVVALDVDELSDARLAMAFEQLLRFSRFDHATRMLEQMERRGLEEVDEHRNRLVERALFADELEVVRHHVEKMKDEDRRRVELDLLFGRADATVAAVEAHALEVLTRDGDDEEYDEIDLAAALLRRRPALGIFVARGAMSAERPEETKSLARCVEQVRDKLMLPPGDRAGELRDLWAEQRIAAKLRKLAERISEERRREAAAEAEELRQKYAEVLSEREELQAQMTKLQRELARAEQSRVVHLETVPPSRPPAAAPSRADLGRLRRKIERLKGIIDDKNQERSALRKQVCELNARLEDARADHEPNGDALGDTGERDTFDALDDVETGGADSACLLPRFDDAVRDALDHLPAYVARRAVVSAAELATSSTAGWTDVKRLQSAGVYTRRLGRDWRMFFRLEPERKSLVVLEVVSRQDFERALVRYR